MTRNSLTAVLEAIDELKSEDPRITEEFLKACRSFWAAKYDLWQFDGEADFAEEHYPWMSCFETYEEFEGVYSAMVYDSIKDCASRGELSGEDRRSINAVYRKFEKVTPDDIAVIPMIEEETEFVTAKPVLILPYGKKIPFYICEVGREADTRINEVGYNDGKEKVRRNTSGT